MALVKPVVHRTCLALLAALISPGCSPQAWLDGAATSQETLVAKQSLALLFQKDLDALTLRMAPELQKQVTPEVLAKILAEVPPGSPADPQLVGYNYFTSDRMTQAFVSLQYKFPAAYLLAQVQVTSSGAAPSITALHVQRLSDSLERMHAFRLAGKSPLHFLMLGLAILVPLFILFTLVLCAQTPLPRRKWLWMLFVALGIGKVSLNWTTGAMGFRPLSFQLFGAAVVASSSYAPWILSVSMPIGALLFLLRRQRLRRPLPLVET